MDDGLFLLVGYNTDLMVPYSKITWDISGPEDCSILINNADSDKVPHNEAFHIGLHRFPNNF